jgi:hypothetical protein
MREALEKIAAPLGNPPELIDGYELEAALVWWQNTALDARKFAREALAKERSDQLPPGEDHVTRAP